MAKAVRLILAGVTVLCGGLLVAPAVSSDEKMEPTAFEILVTSSENEVFVEAVSGCLFGSVRYSSGERPGRSARVTESGIAGPAATGVVPGGEGRPPESEQFEIVLHFSADGVSAESVAGCRWGKLAWSCGEGGTCRARVTEQGVLVLGRPEESTE